ncbi:hypothetical protein Dimus_029478 [Dionaea muscipula]
MLSRLRRFSASVYTRGKSYCYEDFGYKTFILGNNLCLLFPQFATLLITDVALLQVNEHKHKHTSPTAINKIRKSYIPMSVPPSRSRGTRKNDGETEEDRPNIKASFVPRPRAVLSSPDNDSMIGSNNKAKVGRHTVVIKDNDPRQNMLSQCKISPRNATAESSKKRRARSKAAIDHTSNMKGKEGLVLSV